MSVFASVNSMHVIVHLPTCHIVDHSYQHLRFLDLSSCRIAVPSPEAMLFHLLLHANQHGFRPLRLLFDIRWSMEKDLGELDPDVLHSLINTVQCRTSCYYSLLLAAKLAAERNITIASLADGPGLYILSHPRRLIP